MHDPKTIPAPVGERRGTDTALKGERRLAPATRELRPVVTVGKSKAAPRTSARHLHRTARTSTRRNRFRATPLPELCPATKPQVSSPRGSRSPPCAESIGARPRIRKRPNLVSRRDFHNSSKSGVTRATPRSSNGPLEPRRGWFRAAINLARLRPSTGRKSTATNRP